MTNGTITKKLLKAAKELTGDKLKETATYMMLMFPLSSHKLLYDTDKGKVSPEAWEILLEVAVATDTRKGESANRLLITAGCKPMTEYGRAKL